MKAKRSTNLIDNLQIHEIKEEESSLTNSFQKKPEKGTPASKTPSS